MYPLKQVYDQSMDQKDIFHIPNTYASIQTGSWIDTYNKTEFSGKIECLYRYIVLENLVLKHNKSCIDTSVLESLMNLN
jgi:hypothetical protein